ncbi:MAG: CehA/McbA family metallohydrolase [Planctomycetota bacterium]
MLKIISSYDAQGQMWLRGQLHTHTTRSDGTRDPQIAVNAYTALGYDFLMLSDHDCLSALECLDGYGMLLIPGNEISSEGPHILHVDARALVASDPDRQKVINAINAAGGLAVCNHPNWGERFNHFPQTLLEQLEGYAGLEIYNSTIRRLSGSEIATDRWDILLSQGRRIWGFGNDDSHHDRDTGLAWNMVWARERTVPAVIDALRRGSFYVSSGVIITAIRVQGEHISVTAPGAQKMIVSGLYGQRLLEQAGDKIVYRVGDEDHGYVRITAAGGPDQFAFTQPFFIERSQADLSFGEAPKYRVARVDQPLKLDGVRGDATWERIKPMTKFVDMRLAKPSSFAPDARLATDGRTLYLSVVCPELDLTDMKLKVREHEQGRLWTDDGIELFIDHTNRRTSYLHVMVNAAGYWHTIGMDGQAAAAVPITVQAGRREYAYALEIGIPLAALGEDATFATPWAFNLTRNRYGPPVGHCQWAFTEGTNHHPRLFGELIFDS